MAGIPGGPPCSPGVYVGPDSYLYYLYVYEANALITEPPASPGLMF